MGATFGRVFRSIVGSKEVRIMMCSACGRHLSFSFELTFSHVVGLDASGKTTMLYKMKLGGSFTDALLGESFGPLIPPHAEIVTSIPTIGMNIESLEYKNIHFSSVDIGGRGMIRPLLRHYYQGTKGIIFTVDSNDRERIEEAASELARLKTEETLNEAALLVFANKQDLPNAMSVAEMTDKLGLHGWNDRAWCTRSQTISLVAC